MDILDYGGLLALNCTYTGNKVITAFRYWLKLHNEHEWECIHPDTGEKAHSIHIFGDLCRHSGITSTYSPKCIRALAYMMLAEYYISNGWNSDAEYCVSVVENISCSGYTLCRQLILDCKEQVQETKIRLNE